MGDLFGRIRGRSKLEVWLKLRDLHRTAGGYVDPDPKNKKSCKKEMALDAETHEWTLGVRVDKVARTDPDVVSLLTQYEASGEPRPPAYDL